MNRLKERIETLEYENAEVKQEKEIIERNRIDLMHQLQTISKQSHDDPSSSLGIHSMPRKSLVELQQSKRPKPTANVSSSSSKSQSMPKTVVVRNSEPSMNKPKATTSNGRRTPTSVLGANGIKNNLESSRKLASLPATMKRSTTITTTESVAVLPTTIGAERVDSGNGESDEETHLLQP